MILVTGATGLNGRALIERLSARGVPARALVRSLAKAEALSTLPKLEIVEGDMARPDTLARALHGVDRAMLISSSDPAMLDVQSSFIDAARKAGVAHVVKLSGIMPELDSPFRFARMHGEIERRLKASGMAFTHLRAGEFMPAYFRQVPSIVAKSALFLPMENARIASIDVGDIAEVAATVLTTPGHEGKIYPLTGPEALTMTEACSWSRMRAWPCGWRIEATSSRPGASCCRTRPRRCSTPTWCARPTWARSSAPASAPNRTTASHWP